MALEFPVISEVLPALVAFAPGFLVIYIVVRLRGGQIEESKAALLAFGSLGVSSLLAAGFLALTKAGLPPCGEMERFDACLYEHLGLALLAYAGLVAALVLFFWGFERKDDGRRKALRDEETRRKERADEDRALAMLWEARQRTPHGALVILELRDGQRVQGTLAVEAVGEGDDTQLYSVAAPEPIPHPLARPPERREDAVVPRRMLVRSADVKSITILAEPEAQA